MKVVELLDSWVQRFGETKIYSQIISNGHRWKAFMKVLHGISPTAALLLVQTVHTMSQIKLIKKYKILI